MSLGHVLTGIAGLILPSPLEAIRAPVRPNRYASSLPSQSSIAGDQAMTSSIRGGLSGRSGSEADFAQEQASGSSALGAPLDQFLPSARRPYSATHPHLPPPGQVGDGTGPFVGPFKGWVLAIRGPRGQVLNVPHVIPTTLLDPKSRTPKARDVVGAYDATHKGSTRLVDMFGD